MENSVTFTMKDSRSELQDHVITNLLTFPWLFQAKLVGLERKEEIQNVLGFLVTYL